MGIGIPLGSAYQTTGGTDVSLGDWSSITIPVQLDLGVRLGGAWFLGGYFSYGFAGSRPPTQAPDAGIPAVRLVASHAPSSLRSPPRFTSLPV